MTAADKLDPMSIGATVTLDDAAGVHANMVLSAHALAIVAPFLADESDSRYYLRGINVAPAPGGGVILCATSGAALAVYHDRAGICKAAATFQVDAGMLAACNDAGSSDIVVMRNGRLTVLDQHGGEVYIQPGAPVIESLMPYPAYHKVIPLVDQLRPGLISAMDGDLISLVTTAAAVADRALLGGTALRALQFFNVDGNVEKSTVVRITSLPDFLAVLMPLRVEPQGTLLPDWLTAARSAA